MPFIAAMLSWFHRGVNVHRSANLGLTRGPERSLF
jgi:hypothetical protein